MTKILITGSSGFVGKNILSSKKFTNNFQIYSPSSKDLDLLDSSNVSEYFKRVKPDIVIHCAGKVGGIMKNINSQYEFLHKNSVMILNLINTCITVDIRKFINISSSCIYPKSFNRPITENDLLTGKIEPTNEGYALAKIIGLKLTEYISNNLEGYKTIIPCNLYGPYDNFDENDSHMIPAVINKIDQAKILNLESVKMWGSGNVKREFMFIEDFVDFLLFYLKNFDKVPQKMNVGTGKDYSIKEYYNTISKIIGFEGSIEPDHSKPEGMTRKLVDITNQNKLGWSPSYNLEEGILKTYNFFKLKNEQKI